MTTKTKPISRAAAPRIIQGPKAVFWQTTPSTTEERLRAIEAMSQRISNYVQFIGTVAKLNGTSAEAKEKAVIAFFERMVVLERQLARIQEELQLE